MPLCSSFALLLEHQSRRGACRQAEWRALSRKGMVARAQGQAIDRGQLGYPRTNKTLNVGVRQDQYVCDRKGRGQARATDCTHSRDNGFRPAMRTYVKQTERSRHLPTGATDKTLNHLYLQIYTRLPRAADKASHIMHSLRHIPLITTVNAAHAPRYGRNADGISERRRLYGPNMIGSSCVTKAAVLQCAIEPRHVGQVARRGRRRDELASAAQADARGLPAKPGTASRTRCRRAWRWRRGDY